MFWRRERVEKWFCVGINIRLPYRRTTNPKKHIDNGTISSSSDRRGGRVLCPSEQAAPVADCSRSPPQRSCKTARRRSGRHLPRRYHKKWPNLRHDLFCPSLLQPRLSATKFSPRRIVPRILLVSALKDLRSTTTTTQLPKMSRGSLMCR